MGCRRAAARANFNRVVSWYELEMRPSWDNMTMAMLHRATLMPSKGDLVEAWLPSRPWAPPEQISSGVSYRLDDPAGEVGMEGFLLTDAAGHTVHIPLTYRGQPLEGAEPHLLGTMEHSVLGTRWVYDGCRDPVWADTLARTIVTGGTQAEELVDAGGSFERLDPQVQVRGSGEACAAFVPIEIASVHEDAAAATISCSIGDLVVVRRVGADPHCVHTLTATWGAQASDVLLAGLRPR